MQSKKSKSWKSRERERESHDPGVVFSHWYLPPVGYVKAVALAVLTPQHFSLFVTCLKDNVAMLDVAVRLDIPSASSYGLMIPMR